MNTGIVELATQCQNKLDEQEKEIKALKKENNSLKQEIESLKNQRIKLVGIICNKTQHRVLWELIRLPNSKNNKFKMLSHEINEVREFSAAELFNLLEYNKIILYINDMKRILEYIDEKALKNIENSVYTTGKELFSLWRTNHIKNVIIEEIRWCKFNYTVSSDVITIFINKDIFKNLELKIEICRDIHLKIYNNGKLIDIESRFHIVNQSINYNSQYSDFKTDKYVFAPLEVKQWLNIQHIKYLGLNYDWKLKTSITQGINLVYDLVKY